MVFVKIPSQKFWINADQIIRLEPHPESAVGISFSDGTSIVVSGDDWKSISKVNGGFPEKP